MLNAANNADNSALEFLVDAHVHIHPCFNLGEQLDVAADNLAQYDSEDKCGFVLCLTECWGTHRFEELAAVARDACEIPSLGNSGWRINPAEDHRSVVAEHLRHPPMVIVSGRQIVTAEGLEILGLGAVGEWPDGRPIRDTIERLKGADAIPVLPWGFGKWLGRRGRVANEIIAEYAGRGLFLGDNSGRLGIAPEPEEFRKGRDAGATVLPGSDPLPFSSEVSRTGSYGFHVQDVRNLGGIWTSLQAALKSGDADPRPFGRLESPLRFMRNQIAMQYKNRVGG